MPPRRVIGIDAGGTKLLGGVVDEQMVVHHRVHRTWRGAGRHETLDIFKSPSLGLASNAGESEGEMTLTIWPSLEGSSMLPKVSEDLLRRMKAVSIEEART